jgi:hypothetical protein
LVSIAWAFRALVLLSTGPELPAIVAAHRPLA